MSQGLVERQHLQDIGDAIRSKNGSTDTYTPAEMAQAISGIHTADEVVLVQKTVNANGQYNASDDSADGYSGVRVNVPNSYSASDEGKVISNGDLVAQTTKQITTNGTHDTTTNNSVSVNVPNSYAASDNGKVVVNQELVAQTSKNINANGTHDTTANNSVVVNVPNSYAAADEGKVVSNGALVGQTSRNVTMNGTYDTTENNQVVVNVPSGGGGSANILYGTTDPTSQDGSDGSIYIKHIEIGVPPTNLLADYQNIDLWTKNKAAFTTHTVQYTDGVSRVTHKGGNGYERIFVPVDVESNTDYTFILQFYPETNVSYGYDNSLAMAVSQDDQTNTGSSGNYNNLGKENLSRTAANDFSTYYINFNSGSYTRIYAIIDLNIPDGQQNVLDFRKIYLMKGTYTDFLIPGEITNVLLRKDGYWYNLIGSNIEDVNLG